MSRDNSTKFDLYGIFFLIGFMVALILLSTLAVPASRESGFRHGACVVLCGDAKALSERDGCYCESPNKDRLFKPLPEYPD